MPKIPKLLYDGYQHQLRGQLEQAAQIYRKILRAEPRNSDVLILLGTVCSAQRQYQAALEAYDTAIRVKPDSPQAHFNRGLALEALKRPDAAADAYYAAYRLRPELPHALSRVAALRCYVCDWRDYSEIEREIRKVLREGRIPFDPGMAGFIFNDPELICAAAKTTTSLLGPAPARPTARQASSRQPGPIRLAYLSADYRYHATAHLITELIQRHDRARFEVTAISIGPNDRSEYRARLEQAFDRFLDLTDRPTEEIVATIRGLGIEILVDLMGHAGRNRMDVIAARAAPVQVNFLGYPGTMGADFADYIIVDRFLIPVEEEKFYTEKPVRLPDSYQPNDTRNVTIASRSTRAECGLPEHGVVLCSFNNSSKITPQIFDIWMRLLDRVPNSVLWLLDDQEQPVVKENLMREAAARGADPARLVFSPYVQTAKHLGRQALADLFVDTFPCSAHTSASDAMRVGLPLVTCAGRSFQSRVAGSVLLATGLGELVTYSLEEYEALIYALATDPARLSAVKKRLMKNLPTAPLFDIDRYRRHLESAYMTMLEIWQSGEPPRAIKVDPIGRDR